ncbi:hypothetical protein FTX61_07750 [Nitriliruptoraceae bacterium ZYF776]|nr:hypothetical protein [Profundirhabdus halotolerans]
MTRRLTTRHGWARAITGALAAALLAGLVAAPATPAAGQQSDGPQVRLTLSAMRGVLGPGAVVPGDPSADELPERPTTRSDLDLRVLIENTGSTPVDELRLVVEVHPAAGSRGELRAALDGDGPTTDPIHVHGTDVRDGGTVLPGVITGIEDVTASADIPWADDGGVHPLRLAVVRGTEVLDEVSTAVVWLNEPPSEPLQLAAVWPLDGPPWRTAGDQYPTGVDRAIRPGGRLDAILRAVEQHPDADVLLAPTAHLLEDLRDRADGYVLAERVDGGALETRQIGADEPSAEDAARTLERVRVLSEAQTHDPLARPYADADLTALLGRDDRLRELAGELASAGRQRLSRLLEGRADPSAFLLTTPFSPEVLDLIAADVIVAPYTGVDGPDPRTDPTLPDPVRDVRSAGGRPVTLLVADPYLSDLLATLPAGGAVVATQRVLAETAMVFHEAPGTADRALVMLPPEGWSPTVDEAQRLLGALADATWLELTNPRTMDATAVRGGTTSLATVEGDPLPAAAAAELSRTLADLDAVSRARPPDVGELDGRSLARLRDELLRSTSRWYTGAARAEADALVRDVRSAIDATVGELTIASGTQITLTASEGSIPVTLQRTRGGPIEVRVQIDSQGRLDWPAGRESETLSLDDGATQTVSFPTSALSTGTFPVTVRVTDPSGRIEFDRTTLSVRSTAIAGPALLIVGGVAVLLLLAAAVRRRPRRRDRSLEVVR